MISRNARRLIAGLLLLLLLASCSGCSEQELIGEPPAPAVPSRTAFAAYQDPQLTIQPNLPAYQVAADLSNVVNRQRFVFSAEARQLLAANSFAVVPAQHPEFFQVYETNRYAGVPNFVTTDAMLHNYHLYFNHLLKTTERTQLLPQLQQLNRLLLAAASRHTQELAGTPWENAARRNLAFFSVGSCLLEPNTPIPAIVDLPVSQELVLIRQHNQTAASPVMNLGAGPDPLELLQEDYSQYIPRGHYAQDPALSRYFQAMMWYGRLTFRLKNEDETRSAALITLALRQDPAALKKWEQIYQPTSFFVGKSDDLGYHQLLPVLESAFGPSPSPRQLIASPAAWEQFRRQAAALEPPALNSIPIFDENIQPDREREIKGFRLLGQRFTLDAAIFQRLIYREVKERADGQRRLLPDGLDIPAALGSVPAYAQLQSQGDTDFPNYPENMSRLRQYIGSLPLDSWSQNLYWNWLYTLRPLVTEYGPGYPAFMRSPAWSGKQLVTFLGSWAELKHDTILYAKQVYAEMGGGEEAADDRGYVEPNPLLFARLAALTAMTREGLLSRELLAAGDRQNLDRMEQLARSLQAIAEKELADLPLTEPDYELIRSFGGQLEHFWLEALREEGVVSRSQIWENPSPVVADVATAPPNTVLEVGTGYVSEIYVVVPVAGSLRLAKGAVFSYYQFPWAAGDRLTDQAWQEMLNSGSAPPPPSWTQPFTAREGILLREIE